MIGILVFMKLDQKMIAVHSFTNTIVDQFRWEDFGMRELKIGRLIEVVSSLAAFRQMLASYNVSPLNEKPAPFILNKDDFASIKRDISDIVGLSSEFDLSITLSNSKQLLEELNGAPDFLAAPGLDLSDSIGFAQARMLRVKGLVGRICDMLPAEMSLRFVVSLSAASEKRLLEKQPFGEKVAKAFPSVNFEIVEAGKCFAFERYTACVFHLMRTMEFGVRATANCLGIPDPTKPRERNWGHILREIDTAAKVKWPAPSDRLSGDFVFFEDIYASLDAIKNPWRNATMHVERIYTEVEAEHIFGAVKGFMIRLSERMDEKGNPRA